MKNGKLNDPVRNCLRIIISTVDEKRKDGFIFFDYRPILLKLKYLRSIDEMLRLSVTGLCLLNGLIAVNKY